MIHLLGIELVPGAQTSAGQTKKVENAMWEAAFYREYLVIASTKLASSTQNRGGVTSVKTGVISLLLRSMSVCQSLSFSYLLSADPWSNQRYADQIDETFGVSLAALFIKKIVFLVSFSQTFSLRNTKRISWDDSSLFRIQPTTKRQNQKSKRKIIGQHCCPFSRRRSWKRAH